MGVISLTPINFSANKVRAVPSETKVVTITGNTSQNRTENITLPENAIVSNVTTNTGTVTFTQNGVNVTVNLSGGTGEIKTSTFTSTEWGQVTHSSAWVWQNSYPPSFPSVNWEGFSAIGSPYGGYEYNGNYTWYQDYIGMGWITTSWTSTETVYPYTVTIYYTTGFIKLTLPISLTANINPNVPGSLENSFSILNNSSSVVNITFSVVAGADTPAKVVEHNKFADWTKLNCQETKSNIAFGIDINNTTNWMKAEGTGESLAIPIAKDENKLLNLKVLHGYAWDGDYTLNYILSVRVALS